MFNWCLHDQCFISFICCAGCLGSSIWIPKSSLMLWRRNWEQDFLARHNCTWNLLFYWSSFALKWSYYFCKFYVWSARSKNDNFVFLGALIFLSYVFFSFFIALSIYFHCISKLPPTPLFLHLLVFFLSLFFFYFVLLIICCYWLVKFSLSLWVPLFARNLRKWVLDFVAGPDMLGMIQRRLV